MVANPTETRRLTGLALLALAAIGLAVFYYFTGSSSTLPVQLVPHLKPLPFALDSVAVGAGYLPLQVSGFVVSLTHDVAGPFVQPAAATAYLVLLAVLVAGWMAVVSTLRRTAFVLGAVPVIFLLLSLTTEELGIFGTHGRNTLYLLLTVVVGGGFALHAFAPSLALRWRHAVMAALVAAMSGVLLAGSQLPPAETALLLAAHATHAGALLLGVVVLWVSIENIRALLWFNTQAEQPQSRFGLLPFVAASLLYLGILFMYVWNGNRLPLLPGVSLDPLVLLLPAVLIGWVGLPQRAPTYRFWMPYFRGMSQLYPLVVLAAAGALAYAFASENTPFIDAAREFTGQSLLLLGAVFLMYVLVNFAPLIRKRLRVYRVVFEPKYLPFFTVYIVGVAGLAITQSNHGLPWPDQIQAAQFNHLGDLARLQSEGEPDNLSLAVLAERYYAESGDVLYRSNLHAQLGRAALYRFRNQRQNEINALNRALHRGPNEKVSARLAALYSEPQDLLDALEVLRTGLKGQPNSADLTSDLAQVFTRTALTDSVAYYMDRAAGLAPKSYASRTNQLAFLLQQGLLPAARKLAASTAANEDEAALASNLTLLALQTEDGNKSVKPPQSASSDFGHIKALNEATFAQVYHTALADVRGRRASLLPTLARLSADARNASYYEQLVFLQALTRHAVGEERAARQQLAPLLVGTGADARYYQNVLGLWQLQQGQYAAAAEQLDRAGLVDSVLRQAIHTLAQRPEAAASPAHIGAAWLVRAQQAEQQRNEAAAAKSYQRIVRDAPFNERALLAAANFYTRRKDHMSAYEALHAGLEENPRSSRLLRAYVLAAADAGLNEYASEALAQLKQRLSSAEYSTFAATFSARQAARAAAAASFSAAPTVPLLP